MPSLKSKLAKIPEGAAALFFVQMFSTLGFAALYSTLVLYATSTCTSIYRPFVEESAVSFETAVPTVADFAARIALALKAWQWLVAERSGRCIGCAYGSSHLERAAYRRSVQVSVYVHAGFLRQGVGRSLSAQWHRRKPTPAAVFGR